MSAADPTTVVVTGAAGFIGSNLAESLLADGFRVLGIDYCTQHEPWVVERNLRPLLGHPGFTFVRKDLALAELEPLFADVDTVFHLAARAGVRTSWGTGFGGYVTSNVAATQRVMEAAIATGVRRVVVPSSSSVYGGTAGGPSSEDLLLRPMSPYAVSKLATEQLALAYARRPQREVSVVALRYFTVYGPRQRDDMAISRMIKAALSGETFTVYGDGNQKRDFTYVEDTVRATRLAMHADVQAEVVNVGSGSVVALHELIDLVGEVTGRPLNLEYGGVQDGDVPTSWADVEYAADTIGYRPLIDLRTGVTRSVEWFRANADAAVTR
nr:NAD-dependent epimerase/dehydratase family protein [Kibdelosporangium sp. MJ126-NF4]CEL19958.1 UDP-glucose 4-epimerase [Kibdelosporangium sp. MJ126-NF4]CTQ97182.1 UDP-glucose 4-epimerase (EC 5.1.3.2) [Kibdelosporangium sp. MJ126-NF4]